ncbi:MAG TPA: nucleoside triphosphate pyrophosphatase [Solirubrobacteraceae bacterium]|jgi:septum formation protein|nr:nucleoside triphosphate pyrophosphatase [Solirubrobacteraceae bacterium]
MTGRPRLILASGSPQRRAILETLGVEFVTSVSGVDELAVGAPSAVALENALRKARAVADRLAAGSRPETTGPADSPPVLGVDTLVAVESPDAESSTIYGKPADERAARATLEALSGRTHIVVSGLALVAAGAPTRSATVVTRVRMRRLEAATIDWYVACGEWAGRAGGYAIQGRGIVLVAGIEGDYSNVVGLPVQGLLDLWPELLGH